MAPHARHTSTWLMLFAAWLIALLASLGALFVGEVLGQAPCLLCWYQRCAMFPLALILGIACLREDGGVRIYAVPLALLGAAVALWHSLLYLGVIVPALQPCSQGPSCASADMTILGGIPLPLLSLTGFAAIGLLLALAVRKEPA